jgi:four helix bundle protein
MAHRLEEFPVFRDAEKFCDAVTATLTRSSLRRNSKAYEQIEDANDSILANMDEGFAQESDDGFSKYLYYSKGSVGEVIRRLKRAARKGLVRASDVEQLERLAEPLEKQYGGFIKYLKQSGFKNRGRFR